MNERARGRRPHTMNHTRYPTGLLLAISAAALVHTLQAQSVDPDPELFDGTRTKKEQIQQDGKKSTDKWEDANLILYDSTEQGSAEGGQGRTEGQGAGYAEGTQGGVGMQAGIPLPMGGGGGQAQQGDMQIPTAGGGGTPSDKQTIPGATPAGQQSTPTSNGPSAQGAPPSGGKPGDVSIGDPSQKIATSAQPVNKVQGGVPPPPTGEPIQPSKGEDTTSIPNSASGQQSNQRGGGVEKGDAMPTDI